jgi:hypothetical protein
MTEEVLSEYMTLTMTPSDKQALVRMSNEQGATMRGYIRKLIRDAARASKRNQASAASRRKQEGDGRGGNN